MPEPKPSILFFGTASYAVPALEWLCSHDLSPALVVTQPDKAVGRDQAITAPAIKQAAVAAGVPVIQPDRLTADDFKKRLAETEWTVGIVAAYGRILPSWLLALPEKGVLNLHPSLLPNYRGPSPIQTVLANGELTTGNTLMLLDTGMDTGPIIGQQPVPISLRETTPTLSKKLADAAPALLEQCLLPYLTGTLVPRPQPATSENLTHLLTRADGKINWHDSADRIERLYRAYTPWPGVWTTWQGATIKLLALTKKTGLTLQPGMVSWRDGTLSIGCGTDAVQVEQLQREGKKASSAASFMNGYPTFAGSQLV